MKEEIIKALERENYPLALTLLDDEIRRNPEDPILLYNFGICCSKTQNHKKTISIFQSFLEKFPKFVENSRVYEILIYSHIQLKHFKDAIALIDERLKINTKDLNLLSFLAYAQEHSGDHESAIAIHREILKLSPENKNSLNSLGYLLSIKENLSALEKAEAVTAIKKALELSPDNAAYLDSFGVLLQKLGKHEEAKRAFEKALFLDPENPILLDRLKIR